MKKILQALGLILLLCVLGIGGLFGYGFLTGSKLDASSKACVDESIPLIVSNWSKEEALKHASPQLRQMATDEQLTQLFNKLNELGPMQSYDGSKGDSKTFLNLKMGRKEVSAAYVAKAKFQNGSAEIKVALVQNDGAWQISNCHVDSPLLLK